MFNELFRRLLVISPHADDEILGCGGLMARVLAEVPSANVRVIVIGTGRVTDAQTGHVVTTDAREQEMAAALNIVAGHSLRGSGIECSVLYSGMELQLDKIGMYKIVSDLDTIISDFRPTTALVCHASHHQDHQITESAAIAAMRPSPSNRIRFAGLYEYSYLEAWSGTNFIHLPKFYVDISRYLDVKLAAFQAYKSQQRPDPADLRSLQTIEALARTRGIGAGVRYAEAFFPLRMTI